MEKVAPHGTLVVSLDFELFWGMTDKVTLEEYGANIRGVRTALPAILELFTRYGIHATWAVVGMLTQPTKSALVGSLPSLRPEYKDTKLSTYEYMKTADIGDNESVDPHHFGASLLRKILQTTHQEVGSHTFSHYYCVEEGQTLSAFEADLVALEESLRPFGVRPVSLVLPRNQWREDYLPAIRAHGFTSFRGNQRGFVYVPRKDKEQSLLVRALRLLDQYVPLFGAHLHRAEDMRREELPHNIPASFFFRPFSPALSVFEPLRMQRLTSAMTKAAKEGSMFHIWWHPHNFGVHQKENLKNLEHLLKHFVSLQQRYGMRSLTMSELATELSS